MKTVGLLGGLSWESTTEYYKLINTGIKEQLGGLHSGKILLYSFDFDEIEQYQNKNDWKKLSELLCKEGNNLKKSGADFIAICSNTMNKIADEVEKETHIKVLHIADSVAKGISNKNMNKVGLLGTEFTMSEDFYKGRLKNKFNIETIIPEDEDRKIIHAIIYKELCCGILKNSSKEKYISIINKLIDKGAEGIILGCTEIPLLIQQEDSKVPLFDSTQLHCNSIIEEMLK